MMELLKGLTPLRLPNGEVLQDAYVVENFVQDRLGLDPDTIWDDLRAIEKESVAEDQSNSFPEIKHLPYKARLIPGNHHALQYRGNELTRHKVWFQTNIKQGYLKYSYTGWQHMIAPAQCDVQAMPKSTQQLMEYINRRLPVSQQMNHGIFTLYKHGKDCIGAHSDKLQSIADGSWIIVIKFGASRYFDFLTATTSSSENSNVLYHEKLPAGTAVLVKSDTANVLTKHAVPPMSEPTESSGSIVFRRIQEVLPWERQLDNTKKARREKLKKREAKRKETTKDEPRQQDSPPKTKRQRI